MSTSSDLLFVQLCGEDPVVELPSGKVEEALRRYPHNLWRGDYQEWLWISIALSIKGRVCSLQTVL